MKKFLMAVAALTCMSGIALAGPNAGGTIVAHDANLVYTTDIESYCGQGDPLTVCENADVMIESVGADAHVWKVYAAFHEDASPRLRGMTWGATYSDNILLAAWGPCIGDPNNGAAEFPGANWPASGTGTSIVWQFTQTDHLVEAYWFAGYTYYGDAGVFQLTAHSDPVLGGMFGDDSIPALLDDIAGFGSLGFNTSGEPVCPQGQQDPEGACCIGEDCTITTEANCQGVWQGANVPCDPNPCLTFGACCVGEECFVVTRTDCAGMGGEYQGDDTLCDPNPCVFARGACCIGEECFILTEGDCTGQGGEYLGDDSVCEPNPCEEPNPTEQTTWGQIKANYR